MPSYIRSTLFLQFSISELRRRLRAKSRPPHTAAASRAAKRDATIVTDDTRNGGPRGHPRCATGDYEGHPYEEFFRSLAMSGTMRRGTSIAALI